MNFQNNYCKPQVLMNFSRNFDGAFICHRTEGFVLLSTWLQILRIKQKEIMEPIWSLPHPSESAAACLTKFSHLPIIKCRELAPGVEMCQISKDSTVRSYWQMKDGVVRNLHVLKNSVDLFPRKQRQFNFLKINYPEAIWCFTWHQLLIESYGLVIRQFDQIVEIPGFWLLTLFR
jgi:hypothetical protein